MGTWGIGAFENDDACDWAAALSGQTDLDLIEDSFDSILNAGPGYVDASDGQKALAGAEVVACLQGHWGAQTEYTRCVAEWIVKSGLTPLPSLAKKAKQAIARVKTEPSELLELWSEGQEGAKWERYLNDLHDRIKT